MGPATQGPQAELPCFRGNMLLRLAAPRRSYRGIGAGQRGSNCGRQGRCRCTKRASKGNGLFALFPGETGLFQVADFKERFGRGEWIPNHRRPRREPSPRIRTQLGGRFGRAPSRQFRIRRANKAPGVFGGDSLLALDRAFSAHPEAFPQETLQHFAGAAFRQICL